MRSRRGGATGLVELAGLEDASYLTRLSLEEDPVADIAKLALLPELEELNLTRTAVSDLTPLSSLKNVRILELEGSSVVSLEPLRPWASLNGNCRRVRVAELALDAESLVIAQELCESRWAVTPVCPGFCDPHESASSRENALNAPSCAPSHEDGRGISRCTWWRRARRSS